MQLEPQSDHVLAKGLEDHTDSGTYYVRAVIRNSKTDVLISTQNLTDNGNRRFTKTWQVPADPTGQGLWILITYTVYTDSGYTTKSDLYGEKFEEHLILARRTPGGGGGVDVDYKKVRSIIAEELKGIQFPEAPKLDLNPVLEAVRGLQSQVSAITLPEAVQPDLSPVLAAIDSLQQTVSSFEVPPYPETDLSPVLDKLDSHGQMLQAANMQNVQAKVEELFGRIKEFYGNDIDEIKAANEKLSKQFSRIAYISVLPGNQTINQIDE